METLISFHGQELPVRKDKDGNVCLTDLWKLAGSDDNKKVQKWMRQEQAIGFCRALMGLLKVDLKSLLKTKAGKNGATWAHPQIALEYAQYLDPNLGVVVNQNFLERIEEEKNPDLIGERYLKTWKKKGKSDDWSVKRLKGISTRNQFTSALKAHGVERDGYRNCTNAIYNPLYGGTSNVVREKKGLTEKDNIRDNLSDIELTAIDLAEMLATENIKKNNLRGNAQCELAATKAGQSVASAILQNRSK
ncbi:KilA-N domain-containing protein [Dyadobacter sp. CY312]|uniref:KilA-N domain-containing protein n=1 Tax=Dyadobacter sp. CY312 TaxID=2907303 RepID=UPI001F45B8BC|nr:KilA-N domain-containing protein [Dyadobacter sp. CY312]MCE7039183.1 KilA-N domain-containing protein [Dyadobacter sp. CY312]